MFDINSQGRPTPQTLKNIEFSHFTFNVVLRIRVEIVWDNVAMDGWILGCVSGIPRRSFAGADDIGKEREPGIEVIECTL